MNIVVCVKQVLDPDSVDSFALVGRLKIEDNRVVPEGILLLSNPYDEQAVEAALRLKEQVGGKVTVLTIGPQSARDVLKGALAMGADEGVLLDDPAFEGGDSFAIAYILAQAIKKLGSFDLILCGRQSADSDAGIVGSALAEYLGIPSITIAKDIKASGDAVRVEKITADGVDVLEMTLPGLVTVSSEIGTPRYPSLRGMMSASRKVASVPVWKAADIGADPARIGRAGTRTRLVNLFVPELQGHCEFIPNDGDAEVAVSTLLKRLQDEKVI